MLVVTLAFACDRNAPEARYPSWEPTSAIVPIVRDRRAALVDLEQSREIWRERNMKRYSYVRAWLVSDQEIVFTFLVIEGGKVVERALLASSPDEAGLGDQKQRNVGKTRLLWRERGQELGSHAEGAPPLTVDALYDLCRDQVLSVDRALSPRLYFHQNGLLQHCGFLADECPECPSASMQSIGSTVPRPWQVPQDLLCTDHYGLFVAGEDAPSGAGCEICSCQARNQDDPRQGVQAPDDDDPAPQIKDVCAIDPAACPPQDLPEGAYWSCKWLPKVVCGAGFYPKPACVGKTSPSESDDEFWKRCR